MGWLTTVSGALLLAEAMPNISVSRSQATTVLKNNS
jgi:hypothetical protein